MFMRDQTRDYRPTGARRAVYRVRQMAVLCRARSRRDLASILSTRGSFTVRHQATVPAMYGTLRVPLPQRDDLLIVPPQDGGQARMGGGADAKRENTQAINERGARQDSAA